MKVLPLTKERGADELQSTGGELLGMMNDSLDAHQLASAQTSNEPSSASSNELSASKEIPEVTGFFRRISTSGRSSTVGAPQKRLSITSLILASASMRQRERDLTVSTRLSQARQGYGRDGQVPSPAPSDAEAEARTSTLPNHTISSRFSMRFSINSSYLNNSKKKKQSSRMAALEESFSRDKQSSRIKTPYLLSHLRPALSGSLMSSGPSRKNRSLPPSMQESRPRPAFTG